MSDSRLTSEQKQQSSVTVGGAQAPSPLHTTTDTQQYSTASVQRKFYCRWYFLNYIQSELEGKAVKELEEHKQHSSATVGEAQAPSPLHTITDTQWHSTAPVQRKFHCRWYFLNYIQSELEGEAVREREEPHTPSRPTECASADVFRTPDRRGKLALSSWQCVYRVGVVATMVVAEVHKLIVCECLGHVPSICGITSSMAKKAVPAPSVHMVKGFAQMLASRANPILTASDSEDLDHYASHQPLPRGASSQSAAWFVLN
ncbi:hypothetical protein EGR_09098 [Echinococcus granulosus]|uniref:Uncharacterized protein n=1 Tax=Echinococcus granulosus TaxID=6210 RepID=W6U4K7_ECHGR|nr:hypothetical protein EGR_09098 [Echinococcus granulosus]EUB56060.1 hypothetical protein EGR_09098 [Echinococcus granulosus]